MPRGRSIGNLNLPEDLPELLENEDYHHRRNLDRLLVLSDDAVFREPEKSLDLALAAKELFKKVKFRDRKSKTRYAARVGTVLGTAHRAVGDQEAASEIYTQLLRESPAAANDWDFLARCSVLYADLEKWAQSRNFIEKAIQINRCAESLMARAYVFINGYWSGENFDVSVAVRDSLEVLRTTPPWKKNRRIFCTALHNLTIVLMERRIDSVGAGEILKWIDWLYQEHLSGKIKNRWNRPYAKLRWVRGIAHARLGSYAMAVRDMNEARRVLIKLNARADLGKANLDLVEILLDAGGREARLGIPKLVDEIISLQSCEVTNENTLAVLQVWRQMIQDGCVSDQVWQEVLLHIRGRKPRERPNPWPTTSGKKIDTLGF